MSAAWAQQLDAAVALHQQGNLAAAEQAYRWLAQQSPGNPHPRHYLGLIALQRGDAAAAAALVGEAIALDGSVPEFHVNLGNALKRLGRLAEADRAYQRALELRPEFFEASYNRGLLQEDAGQLAAAAASLLTAHQLRADANVVLTSLARVLLASGRATEAIACSERSVAGRRVPVESLVAHADLLMRAGHAQKAVRFLQKFGAATARDPALLSSYGHALDATGAYSEAIVACRSALAIDGACSPAWVGLAASLKNQGNVKESLVAYRRAMDLAPGEPRLRSAYLFTLLMADGVSASELAQAHREFGALFGNCGTPLSPAPLPDAQSVLRVGYLSGDLRRHPVGYFMQRILAGHDPQNVEVTCYHTGLVEDQLSAALRGSVARWVSCGHLSDAALAERIRADGIDVLVELSGHTAGNRLLMLARRPAPVQVSYLGYAHSTCLPWIDFRISDEQADPPAEAPADESETILHLPGSYYCYTPPTDAPDPGTLPALANGRLTFGAFLQLGKLSDATRDAWCALLQAIPDARLLIRAKGLADRSTREALANSFAARGVARERLMLEGWQTHHEHLRAYRRVDCMLDTLPFNLATNTCEALWMGVPTISLRGDHHAARMGASLLRAVGLDEFVAGSTDELVAIARRLEDQPERLADLRQRLRGLVAASSLLDGKVAASGLEELYRRMCRIAAGESVTSC